MICPKCGENVDGSYRYLTCPKCGMTFDTMNMKNEDAGKPSNHATSSSSDNRKVSTVVAHIDEESHRVIDTQNDNSNPVSDSVNKDTWNLNDFNSSSQHAPEPAKSNTSNTQ